MLCQSDHLPMSEPAEAVKDMLLELTANLTCNTAWLPDTADTTTTDHPTTDDTGDPGAP